jgi:transposase
VQAAYAAIVTTQVRLVATLNTEIDQLGQVVAEYFGRHRDAERYLSLPGLGVVLGARILGEFGDDPHRFVDAKARKNYAGTSPITRASGTRRVVLARYARNRRLGDAVQRWAFCSMRGSPGARAYYDTLRKRGIGLDRGGAVHDAKWSRLEKRFTSPMSPSSRAAPDGLIPLICCSVLPVDVTSSVSW